MNDQTQQGGASQKGGTISAPTVERPGQADAPAGTDQTHTIVVLAHDRHGALDRISWRASPSQSQNAGVCNWSK